jgi:hypothetical protein
VVFLHGLVYYGRGPLRGQFRGFLLIYSEPQKTSTFVLKNDLHRRAVRGFYEKDDYLPVQSTKKEKKNRSLVKWLPGVATRRGSAGAPLFARRFFFGDFQDLFAPFPQTFPQYSQIIPRHKKHGTSRALLYEYLKSQTPSHSSIICLGDVHF